MDHKKDNPCLHCGACCAYYRVSFYWGETEPTLGGNVPAALVEKVTEFYSCMRGTNQTIPRCVALAGEIGKDVLCTIYPVRSNTCREFGSHWHNGFAHESAEELARCNKAREAHHLKPLPHIYPRYHLKHIASLWNPRYKRGQKNLFCGWHLQNHHCFGMIG